MMPTTGMVHRTIMTGLLAAAAAIGGYAYSDDCPCTYCCFVDNCHVQIDATGGKWCYLFTDLYGVCGYNLTGGCMSCDLVDMGFVDAYETHDCQAYCFDFYGADCGNGEMNQGDGCSGHPGPPDYQHQVRHLCEEYVGS